MSKIDDGGPAFPCEAKVWADEEAGRLVPASQGMTLRDFFAGQALAGIAARHSARSYESEVDEAFKYADAMLAARSAKP